MLGRWTVTKARGRNPEEVSGPRCVWGAGGWGGKGEEEEEAGDEGEEEKEEEEGQVDRERQDGLPPHLQPRVESPGDLDRLDLGQERAHSCLLIAVAVLLSSTSFLNGLFYGDRGKVFRPYLIFSGYKGWRRGQ